MDRRKFLKFLGGLGIATALPLEAIAARFTDAQAAALMAMPPELAKRTFSDLLNDYLPVELLRQELEKRDSLLSKIPNDDAWSGGLLTIPSVVPK